MRIATAIAAFLLALSGCSNRRDNEERLLLDRAERVDHDAPAPIREQQIADLASTTLQTTELVEVRDTCVEGHRALLRAEQEQDRAGRELGRLTDGDPEARIPAQQAQQVEDAIRSSTTALGQARELLHRCQDELSALRQRHG